MIIDYADLSNYKGQFVMVDGCFDPLHIGHVAYFEFASKFGIPVLCNVQSDQYIQTAKGRPTILPEDQRVRVIASNRFVAHVHLCRTSTLDVLKQLIPLKYIKGADWRSRGLPDDEVSICQDLNIEVVYSDTSIDSSSRIIDQFIGEAVKLSDKVSVDQFQQTLLKQESVSSSFYDEHYFSESWRSGNNDYSVETRRVIEGRNPSNIKDVFSPHLVLDVGCGPGALMYLLHELGIKCYGIDFSASARDLAPPEIRNYIHVGSVTEYYDFQEQFDLVICRELLEHLTVLQVRQAVRVLAQYTSKYLYVTTRFHPSPRNLLDVTNEVEVDPSHITLLNKDFLRLLFLLEGLKSRPDLESKMDWKKYGRVMVFERT
jgi:cytidyltransferase-like protein